MIRDKWPDDPLVPIDGDRVFEAMEASYLGVNELARRAGVNKRTLSLIKQGTTKRCRSSNMTKLAGALRVSARWLSGTTMDEQEFASAQRDLARRHSRLDGPAVTLFRQRVRAALERDYPAETAGDSPHAVYVIREVFDLLVNPSDLRSVLLESGHGTVPRRVAEAKQTSEAMAIALERMLDPWLKGRVPLNVEAVGGLSQWFWDVFERLGPE